MSQPKIFNTAFVNLFNTSLGEHVDVLDGAALNRGADSLARALKRETFALVHLVSDLRSFLEEWNHAEVTRFSEKTEIDWAFDKASEAALRSVFKEVLSRLS